MSRQTTGYLARSVGWCFPCVDWRYSADKWHWAPPPGERVVLQDRTRHPGIIGHHIAKYSHLWGFKIASNDIPNHNATLSRSVMFHCFSWIGPVTTSLLESYTLLLKQKRDSSENTIWSPNIRRSYDLQKPLAIHLLWLQRALTSLCVKVVITLRICKETSTYSKDFRQTKTRTGQYNSEVRLFSDVPSEQQFSARDTGVRIPSGIRYDDKYTIQIVKHPTKPDDMGCNIFLSRTCLCISCNLK